MNRLTVEGVVYEAKPIAAFRREHGLPSDWGVGTLTEPPPVKVSALAGHADELVRLRERTYAAVPERIEDWEMALYEIASAFHVGNVLLTWNLRLTAHSSSLLNVFYESPRIERPYMELAPYETNFVSNFFHDLLWGYFDRQPTTFDEVFHFWLDSTFNLEPQEPYEYNGVPWELTLVSTPFGRVGFLVDTPDGRTLVRDNRCYCPAEAWMREVWLGTIERMERAMSHADNAGKGPIDVEGEGGGDISGSLELGLRGDLQGSFQPG